MSSVPYSWALPGARCVCVSTKGLARHFYPGTILPREHETYSVREVLEIDGFPVLRLVEIVNCEFDFEPGVFEPAFHQSRFRPLVARRTDISVLTALLTPAEQREAADADI